MTSHTLSSILKNGYSEISLNIWGSRWNSAISWIPIVTTHHLPRDYKVEPVCVSTPWEHTLCTSRSLVYKVTCLLETRGAAILRYVFNSIHLKNGLSEDPNIGSFSYLIVVFSVQICIKIKLCRHLLSDDFTWLVYLELGSAVHVNKPVTPGSTFQLQIDSFSITIT